MFERTSPVALVVSLAIILLAVISMISTVPKGGGSRDLDQVEESLGPKKQAALDDATAEIYERLSEYSLAELEQLEKQYLVTELAKVDSTVLKKILEQRKS